MKKILKTIFSVTKSIDRKHKVVTIFGIKFKFNILKCYNLRRHSFYIYILRLWGGIKYKNFIKKNKNAKICVCLHLYYSDMWDKISEYLLNLKPYNYDLFVTLTEEHYDSRIINKIKKFKSDVTIKILPNKGYDVGPFIELLNNINLNSYDIVYKIHSKGVNNPYRYVYNRIFKYSDWFYNLYDGILGELNVHIAIDKLLNNEDIGIVASKNLIINDPFYKQDFTQKVILDNNLKITLDKNYQYVAGTCFAIKAKLLDKIKNLSLTIDDFKPIAGNVFSLVNAIERILSTVSSDGYKIYGIDVKHNEYLEELKILNKYSSDRLLHDCRFNLNYDFYYRFLENRCIKDYKIENVKLKDIRRLWNNKIYSLYETSPYKYIELGKKEIYEQYSIINTCRNNIERPIERFQNLISSINNKGYDSKMMPVVDKDNIIKDGQHRCCILLHKYGGEYEIPVLKIIFLE